MGIDNRGEVRAFLTSRRAKVSPEQAGIPGIELTAAEIATLDAPTPAERGHHTQARMRVIER
jgi:hypothetical protein